MNIKFSNNDLKELYLNGMSEGFSGIPKSVLDSFMRALSMAESASELDDILNPPPFKGLLQKDGSIMLLLCNGWTMNFFLTITGNGENKISVVSLNSAQDKEVNHE